MIKFLADADSGTKVIGLGLSRRNLQLLLEGKPIVIKLKAMGLPWDGEVLLFAGESEASMIDLLRAGGINLPKFQTHKDDEAQARGPVPDPPADIQPQKKSVSVEPSISRNRSEACCITQIGSCGRR